MNKHDVRYYVLAVVSLSVSLGLFGAGLSQIPGFGKIGAWISLAGLGIFIALNIVALKKSDVF
jgi:hypothetical protein